MPEKAAKRGEMNDQVPIGICQIRQGYDFPANVDRAVAMVERAASLGARIVALPEMFFTPYEPAAILKAARHSASALDRLVRAATESEIWIVAGSMPWPSPEERLFNRSFVIGPDGRVVHRHDKIHLFDCTPPGGPAVRESQTIVAGNTLGDFATPWGTASVVVCYDIRFSPLVQLLSARDVRFLFVPAAFSLATGRAHWEMLVRLRAVELQAFVIGVQPARNDDLAYVPWGHSLVASPWGEVLCDAGPDETVALVQADTAEIDRIRAQFPLRAHHRNDLYATLWKGET
jgi:predicted amidohydrolase